MVTTMHSYLALWSESIADRCFSATEFSNSEPLKTHTINRRSSSDSVRFQYGFQNNHSFRFTIVVGLINKMRFRFGIGADRFSYAVSARNWTTSNYSQPVNYPTHSIINSAVPDVPELALAPANIHYFYKSDQNAAPAGLILPFLAHNKLRRQQTYHHPNQSATPGLHPTAVSYSTQLSSTQLFNSFKSALKTFLFRWLFAKTRHVAHL